MKIYNGDAGLRLYHYSKYKFSQGDDHVPYFLGTSEWNAGTCGGMGLTIRVKGVEVGASGSCAATFYEGADLPRATGKSDGTTSRQLLIKSAKPNTGSDRGRARVRVCIDVPLKFDPCSGQFISAADTF
ncbi:hypothetical protein [Demequina sp.]|uniref:hypothetical protein n=1 Tax=Demequina sp. TaxID=2050685 RepID=UPI003A8C3F9C